MDERGQDGDGDEGHPGKPPLSNLEEMMARLNAHIGSKGDVNSDFKFWNTQPVPKLDDESIFDMQKGCPIEPDRPVEDIQKKPHALLSHFEWEELDLQHEPILDQLYALLSENYVEDDDAGFRFDYSKAFLSWALFPPGWRKDWHVGVRVKASGKLVAFISAVPVLLHVREHAQSMPEINFLCVHKKLRSKRLAPVLIKEITRRVHLTGCFQAVYTAGSYLPRPLTANQYYHRSLNTKKLVEVGFSRLPPNMPLSRMIRLNNVPEKTKTPGLRAMEERDVEAACALINRQSEKFQLRIEWSVAEFRHWHLERAGVVYCYVVENPDSHQITDVISFYVIPSTVIRHDKHKTLDAAYLWNYGTEKTALTELMRDMLVVASKIKIDVFNALNMKQNESFFKELRFNAGDGILHYYVYNWKTRPIEPHENALVML
ncbi:Glycylpeptide N-tetradecanoyltransferase 2 [Porphyridium purpureum]|uniref:Glycylpeptide N-tetradecanoyltransferase n=1 Tax=Porphyridium purpureum TaxID=35688 RepID=A0A5J4Z3M4_PORPP|nr:Glycylpeptide N-tetradecanoyltransferase 2 [Porphyridium purpureum]|eukprot:POR1593..scf295_1